MSDTPATTAALRALLLARSGDPPVDVARALVNGAGAGPDAGARLAEVAADGDLSPHQRVIALLAVAVTLADDPTAAAPDAALYVVEEPDIVAAAIATGLSAALTGVLCAAPRDGALSATRRLVGRRCLAAGVVGPHVARLLADAGDHDGAAQAAAADLAPRLAVAGTDALLAAWLHLLLTWAAEPERPLFGGLVRALGHLDPAHPGRLIERLQGLAGAAPERVARACSRIRSEG